MKTGNFKAYLYVYKVQILNSLAYKADVYINMIGQCIVMFATAFFWKALYVGHETVKGATVDDMLVYTIMSSILSILFTANVENRVGQSVRKGTVATDMLKPINLFGIYFFEDLGNTTSLIFENVLPILIIGVIFIAVPAPAGVGAFLAFLLCVVISYLLNWLMAACYSTCAFVALHMGPLKAIKFHMIRLLSGSMIPLWFFPGWLSKILYCLPFPYIYQLPLDLYIGKITFMEALPRIGMQFIWLFLFWLLFCYLQRVVTKHVLVQGG